MKVVFPAPLAPISPAATPGAISSATPSSARRAANCFTSPTARSAGALAAGEMPISSIPVAVTSAIRPIL
jgi:hypothetical protein